MIKFFKRILQFFKKLFRIDDHIVQEEIEPLSIDHLNYSTSTKTVSTVSILPNNPIVRRTGRTLFIYEKDWRSNLWSFKDILTEEDKAMVDYISFQGNYLQRITEEIQKKIDNGNKYDRMIFVAHGGMGRKNHKFQSIQSKNSIEILRQCQNICKAKNVILSSCFAGHEVAKKYAENMTENESITVIGTDGDIVVIENSFLAIGTLYKELRAQNSVANNLSTDIARKITESSGLNTSFIQKNKEQNTEIITISEKSKLLATFIESEKKHSIPPITQDILQINDMPDLLNALLESINQNKVTCKKNGKEESYNNSEKVLYKESILSIANTLSAAMFGDRQTISNNVLSQKIENFVASLKIYANSLKGEKESPINAILFSLCILYTINKNIENTDSTYISVLNILEEFIVTSDDEVLKDEDLKNAKQLYNNNATAYKKEAYLCVLNFLKKCLYSEKNDIITNKELTANENYIQDSEFITYLNQICNKIENDTSHTNQLKEIIITEPLSLIDPKEEEKGKG